MNESFVKFSHKAFQVFLLNPDDPLIAQTVKTLHQEESNIEFIFQVINHLRKIAGPLNVYKKEKRSMVRFSEMDRFISQALSNCLSKKEAHLFLKTLYFSPILYEKFWHQVLLSYHSMDCAETSEMSEIQIASDEALLSLIKKQTGKHRSMVDIALNAIYKGFSWIGLPKESKYWAPAFSMALTAVVVLMFWQPWSQEESIAFQIYKEYVPYAYEESGMRSGSSMEVQNRAFGQFIHAYKMAMSDYVLNRYQDAIRQFDQLEILVPALITDTSDSVQVQWIRDFYFYRGMCYLALEQKSQSNPKNLESAIVYFQEALILARKIRSQNADREIFYLGLTCALDKQIEASEKFLERIAPGSRFYGDAQAMIQLH